MRKLLVLWALGLMINTLCFSQLKQMTNDSIKGYFVPSENIKNANLKFVELSRLQKQSVLKDSLIVICYGQVDNYRNMLEVSMENALAEKAKNISLEKVNQELELNLDDTETKLKETKTKLALWKLGYIPVVILLFLIK